jgi:hypothetical protein
MDKAIGLLIIRTTAPNETGADHFDVAPGVTIDFVKDMDAFMAPFARDEWKARVGTQKWELHIDPPREGSQWVVTVEKDLPDGGKAHSWPSDYWQALKIAFSFGCHLDAYFLYSRFEDGIWKGHDSYRESAWFDTEGSGENDRPLTREILYRWTDFASKLIPLYCGKEACERSDRFTEGVALFCRGLQEYNIRHRLNCFILALEALICSPEARQKEYFLSRIKCFWPQDQPKLLPPGKAVPTIHNIFFLKSKLDHLRDLGHSDTIRESYWRIALQAEQLARSAYSVVLSSPEHYACFTNGQRQQDFWAARNNRILFQIADS